MPYLTNAEENELKRLKTAVVEGIVGDEEHLATKGTRSSSIGFGEERELWDSEPFFFLKL